MSTLQVGFSLLAWAREIFAVPVPRGCYSKVNLWLSTLAGIAAATYEISRCCLIFRTI